MPVACVFYDSCVAPSARFFENIGRFPCTNFTINCLKMPYLQCFSGLAVGSKIEKYIEKSDIPYSHIRPGFFMQNLSGTHATEIREKDEIFVPAGKSKTSFIDAADIGLAIATILHEVEKYKNTAHILTGPESLDYFQVAEILSQVTKRKIHYANPGFLKYRNHYLRNRGLDKKYVDVTLALYFMTRLGTAKTVTTEFKKLTGHNLKTFKEFAQDNFDSFVRNKNILGD